MREDLNKIICKSLISSIDKFLLIVIRFVKTFPCITVYMSSMTNMAVAMDRYRFIVKPNGLQVSKVAAYILMPVIFLVSTALSLPVAFNSKVVPLKVFMVSCNKFIDYISL